MSWKASLILLLAGFTISTSVIIYTETIGQELQQRDPYQEDRGQRTLRSPGHPQYYQQPPPPRHDDHSDETITDQIATIFLDQGWIGAMMLLLMAYMHYSQKTARQDRIKLEDKLVQLLMDNNTQLTKFSAEMENMGRELERIRG